MFLRFRIMMFDQTTQISLIISACMIPDRVSESGNPDFVLTFHCWLYTLYIIVYVTNKNLESWLQRRLAGAEGPGELWLHRHWFMRSPWVPRTGSRDSSGLQLKAIFTRSRLKLSGGMRKTRRRPDLNTYCSSSR